MSEKRTCPDACPWKRGENPGDHPPCYSHHSRAGQRLNALETEGYNHKGVKVCTPITYDEMCRRIAQFPRGQTWRHNVGGDLAGDGDTIDHQLLDQLVKANAKCNGRGFTYTHKPVGLSGQPLINAQAIYAANKSGFTISLSADGLDEADELADLGIAPVVCVVDEHAPARLVTPAGRGAMVCPHQTHGKERDITCNRCMWCGATVSSASERTVLGEAKLARG
jgi:hypothetical protein